MLRAELIGLLTTTATRVTAAVAVVGLIVTQMISVTVLPALGRGDIGPGAEALGADFPALDLTSRAVQLDALNPLGASMGSGSIGIALLAVVLFGVLAGTSDDRYGGIVGAVLASPKRARIVIGKAGAVGLVGAVIGAALSVASLVTLLITLVVTGTPLVIGVPDLAARLALGVTAVVALSLLGLAVGILVRTQLAGVLSMLALLVLEPVVGATTQLLSGGLLPLWTQFLPVTLAQNVIHGASGFLPPAVALVSAAAMTAAALGVASVALARRDV